MITLVENMGNDQSPLYLGFDLSTQQLKAVIITSDLQVIHTVVFDFDADAADFGIKKGVLTNEAEKEVFAPVAMWLRAVDTVLEKLQQEGLDFSRVQGISGAGQQHGSVYWNADGEERLSGLDGSKKLEEQLRDAFAWPVSPNWQDASTQEQCEAFDAALGSEEKLAEVTGSKAHHVFLPFMERLWKADTDSASLAHRSLGSERNTLLSTLQHPGSPWSPRSWLRSFSGR